MSERTKKVTINATRDYSLFSRNDENRQLDMGRHKKLYASMQTYGWLVSFPLSCFRKHGKLYVKEGQHRLSIAETLGLVVYWVEDPVDYDIAMVNATPVVWSVRDYAEKHAANDIEPYKIALRYANHYDIPIAAAFCILAGTVRWSSVSGDFQKGKFEIKDARWGELVGRVYSSITALAPHLKNDRFLKACMAVTRVKSLDVDRLLKSCERCRDQLVQYSTRDLYIEMLDSIYNYRHSNLVALKNEALMAMRERNPATPGSTANRGRGRRRLQLEEAS